MEASVIAASQSPRGDGEFIARPLLPLNAGGGWIRAARRAAQQEITGR